MTLRDILSSIALNAPQVEPTNQFDVKNFAMAHSFWRAGQMAKAALEEDENNKSAPEQWVIEASYTPKHELVFKGIRDNRADALAYADELVAAMYPNPPIESEGFGSDGHRYMHPDSLPGDTIFIVVHLYDRADDQNIIECF